jgi:hypothetical protein
MAYVGLCSNFGTKTVAFCDISPCSLVEVDQQFVKVMEAVRTSETSAYFYETTRH